jgi:uncharacterized protein involved in type VI secretion and phage assembly
MWVDDDPRTPAEKAIARSFVDEPAHGKPLSRRARQTKRSLEAYLKGGVLPRYMERLREIEQGIAEHRRRIEDRYLALREECGTDADAFARRWREQARRFRFDDLNDLIHEHNEWYPIERNLPLDPRTRDYIKPAGRQYRRRRLTPEWVLEEFPPVLRDADAA